MTHRVSALLGAIALVAMTACGSSDGSHSPGSSAGPGPAGAITVEQLVARSADTPIAVQGLLHIDHGTARLCAAILESFPPQCGEPSVEVIGLDPSAVAGTTTAQGVTWKEGTVLTLQRAADGRFTVITASP